jgi:D-alanyl-D-alanine carboxypeptidase/D-alanyl-D-alanine-endopeptidase (penicillin-binding protein 4)
MEFTAQQIADLLQGQVEGDPGAKVSRLSKIEEGTPGSLSYRLEDAAGKITAKTGWIQTGYTLAGFMQTPDGGNLLFTIYNLGKVTEANREAMDDLAMGIYNCGTLLGNQ